MEVQVLLIPETYTWVNTKNSGIFYTIECIILLYKIIFASRISM